MVEMIMNKLILGLDCSTKCTGYCLFESNGKLIKYGCIKPNEKDDAIDRIRTMISEVNKIIEEYSPYLIIEEDVPPALQNSMTVKTLSTLKGGMLALAQINNVSVRYILPNVWQSALKILKSNGSTKKQSIDFVNKNYNTEFAYVSEGSKKNEDDITDSICLVHYYLNKIKEN
jgi:Holliday junction resolvasome RuvABC endonuclease subunit